MSVRRVVPLLTVGNLDSSIATLVDLTGMEVIMNHGWIATLAPPDDHSVQLGLITKDLTAPMNPSVSIEVDDVDAVYEAVRSSGVGHVVHELTDEAWGVRRFFLQDPNGYIVNVLAHQ